MLFSYSQSILLTYPKLDDANKALGIIRTELDKTATDSTQWTKSLERAITYTLLLLESGLMDKSDVVKTFHEHAFPEDKPEEVTLRADTFLDFIDGKLSSPKQLNLLLNGEQFKNRIQNDEAPENRIADILLKSNITLSNLQSGIDWKLPLKASFVAIKNVCDGANPYTKTLAKIVLECEEEEKAFLHNYAMEKMLENNIDTTLYRCFNTMVKKCEFEQLMIKRDEVLRTVAALTVTEDVLARYINRIRKSDDLRVIIDLFNISPLTLMRNPSLSKGGQAKILKQMCL